MATGSSGIIGAMVAGGGGGRKEDEVMHDMRIYLCVRASESSNSVLTLALVEM